MLWSYVQLDDGTQFAYSETRDDGTVRVAVERPVDLGIDHAGMLLAWRQMVQRRRFFY